ncbi:Nse1 non-SMC component of SMC5-6 complex-domain-containing protein [Pilobolus umbonatus]|nr:Nse1 non-SMC component of SMC5-6 complex-domain-containing protein [Pilobolus umbonatus]
MSVSFNDSHRVFIQSMLTKVSLPQTEATKLYASISELTKVPEEDFTQFVADINRELELLDYSIRTSYHEQDGTAYLTMINLKQDQLTEIATHYSPLELTYCNELFEAIVTADQDDFAISHMDALRLGKGMKPVGLSQKETQELLDSLVKDGWIGEEDKGVYYLETRALAELQGYFREQYGDIIKECTICLDIITMGEKCTHCEVRIHSHCASSHFRETSQPVCPQCGKAWSRDNHFGLGLP